MHFNQKTQVEPCISRELQPKRRFTGPLGPFPLNESYFFERMKSLLQTFLCGTILFLFLHRRHK